MIKRLDYSALVISLDFELMWGCHDWSTCDSYGESNIRQVKVVIRRLLDLFEKYQIRATFATVGLIFCKDKKDALMSKPKLLPTYKDSNLSPFKDGYLNEIKDVNTALYFAPDIIKLLNNNKNIEVGTHTFSHYFCWSEGQTIDQFRADLEKAIEVANNCNVQLESIVFPKNEVSKEYLRICDEMGLSCYRGNPTKFYNESISRFGVLKNKVMRLLDSYFKITNNVSIPSLQCNLVNIPASRFLRPYSSKLSFLEPLRLRRIKKELTHVAKYGGIYHLWWHPHNFGSNMEENFIFLEEILKCYQSCRELYGMHSFTMSDITKKLRNEV